MSFRISESDLVDLHTHSTANDGRWVPATLTEAARERGIRVLALTDHDTVKAVPSFMAEARQRGIFPLTGVEVSSWWRGTMQHVLLLNVDLANPRLSSLLAALWAEIQAAVDQGLAALASKGYVFSQLEERRRQGLDVMPVHVLVAGLEAGLAPTFPEVVRFFTEDLKVTFTAGVDMAEAVEAGHAAGGLAILAHPGRAEYGFADNDRASVAAMVEDTGLDGLEVYHWSHGPQEVETYGGLARERGLLVSCGSDSHGPDSQRALRGWEARLCRPLLERMGIEVDSAGQSGSRGD